MTVTVTNTSDGPFAPDGVTTEFPFTFKAASKGEVAVVRRSALGDTTLSGYSVTLGSDQGGTVLFGTAPAAGDPIYILSNPLFENESDFANQGSFSPSSVNKALDRAAIRDIYLKGLLTTALSSLTANNAELAVLAEQVAAVEGLSISITGAVTATSRDVLALIPTTAAPVFLTEAGLEGGYSFQNGNFSAQVTADAARINYIAPQADPTGSSGAWVRLPLASLYGAPQALTYGARTAVRELREAREWMNGTNGRTALHLQVPGFAANPHGGGPGITGGYGKTEYYVEYPESLDSAVVGTFGWALAQAKLNGGGLIYIDPRGQHKLSIPDNVSFRLNDGDDNITIYAPGLNFSVWCDPLEGSVVVKGANVLFWGIEFRTLSGPMSGDFVGDGTKAEIGLVSCSPQSMDKVAFVQCEFRHASDGACDIAGTGFTGASPECNVTFHNCIFWDTDEAQLLGSISDTSTSADARKLFVTHSNTIFAYCGQRQPKALGLALVHMVNCYSIIKPWYRDQPSPVDSPGSCAGAAVQDGGWLLAEGCLWQAGDEIGGYEATKLVPNPTSGATGYINVVDCVAENGCTFSTAGTVSVSTYTLEHTLIPTAGYQRELWVAARWASAGARCDAAPQGQFVWVDGSTANATGETVTIERGRVGRYIRVDPRNEYPPTPAGIQSSTLVTTSRSYTRTVGFTEGRITDTAIGAQALDIVALDSSYFVAQGNGGAANIKFLMSTGSEAFNDGLHLYISGNSSAIPTLKTATSIAVSGVTAASDTLTVTAHGMTTGDWPIFLTSTGTLPTPLGSKVGYYAIVVDANTLKLATSHDNAVAGTAIDLTDAGTGTHTATIGNLSLPDGKDFALNSSSKVIHLIYDAANLRFNVVSRILPIAATSSSTYVAASGGTTVDTQARAAQVQLAADVADLRAKLQAAGRMA